MSIITMVYDSRDSLSAQKLIEKRPLYMQSLYLSFGGRRVLIEILLLLLFVISVGAVSSEYDFLEQLVVWSHQYEEYEIDEIITVLMISSFALLFFVIRRVRELGSEIHRRNQVERRMRHMALHDALTGLPNRVLFRERFEQELDRAQRDGTDVAVLALDLDNFKNINDIMGHAVGDALLQAVAERLRQTVRNMDTVSRLSGDEFAVIQPHLTQPSGSAKLASRMVKKLSQPFDLCGQQVAISVSIGIAVSSTECQEAGELLRNADLALYRAKADGRSTYRFFETDMDQKLRERQLLEQELRQAVAREELYIHYQPLFNIENQTLIGFEALLRWFHKERGAIPPTEFIPIAEETGIILHLGDWIIERACADAKRWPGDFKVAVNLSPVQFKQKDLVDKVRLSLELTGLPAHRLELEITENTLMEDTEYVLTVLRELKQMGVSIAMDDFGTGYSSLSYLRRFPFDKIKIDRSFISSIDTDEADAAIIRAVMALGRSLGMVVMAEGVESENQLRCLITEEIKEAQGFLLGEPQSNDLAHSLCEKHSNTPDS